MRTLYESIFDIDSNIKNINKETISSYWFSENYHAIINKIIENEKY